MAEPYIGPINLEEILEWLCCFTDWSSYPSWPTIKFHLRRSHIDNDYIENNKDYIVETLDRHSSHHACGGEMRISAGTGSLLRPAQSHRLQGWPRTAHYQGGLPSAGRTMEDDDDGRPEIDSSWSRSSRSVPPKPRIRAHNAKTNTLLSYARPAPLEVQSSTGEGEPSKLKYVRLYSFERNSFIPAKSVESSTSVSYISREVAEKAGLEIEETIGATANQYSQTDLFQHEGRTTAAWASEDWITLLVSEFVVTSDPEAADLTIGLDLRPKSASLCNMFRSYQALEHYYRYEAGLVHAPSYSHSPYSLRSRPPSVEPRGPRPPEESHSHTTVDNQRLNVEQCHSRFNGRTPHKRDADLNEVSSLNTPPLSVRSDPVKPSFPRRGSVWRCYERCRDHQRSKVSRSS